MAAKDPEYMDPQPSAAAGISEPNRSKSYDPKKPHITETPITRSNWYKHVIWLNVSIHHHCVDLSGDAISSSVE